MADNAFAFGQLLDDDPSDDGVLAIRRFNETMARHSELMGVMAPFGDGLWVAVRA
jgi:predicted O-methyltransferase YrrM